MCANFVRTQQVVWFNCTVLVSISVDGHHHTYFYKANHPSYANLKNGFYRIPLMKRTIHTQEWHNHGAMILEWIVISQRWEYYVHVRGTKANLLWSMQDIIDLLRQCIRPFKDQDKKKLCGSTPLEFESSLRLCPDIYFSPTSRNLYP